MGPPSPLPLIPGPTLDARCVFAAIGNLTSVSTLVSTLATDPGRLLLETKGGTSSSHAEPSKVSGGLRTSKGSRSKEALSTLNLMVGLVAALVLTCLTRSLILVLLLPPWTERCALLSAVLAALPSAGALGFSLRLSPTATKGSARLVTVSRLCSWAWGTAVPEST